MVSQFVNNSFDQFCDETIRDIRVYSKLVNLTKDTKKPEYCILKTLDLFGINDDDLKEGGDEMKKEAVTNTIRNTKPAKDEVIKNMIYKDKEIYGFLFVYDVSNPKSLQEVKEFVDYISNNEKQENKPIKTKKTTCRK